MDKVLQLRIDIKANEITKKMYDKICKVIENHGGEVMDDGHAPYVEDITEVYEIYSIYEI